MENSIDKAFRPFHNFVSQDMCVTLHVIDILLGRGGGGAVTLWRLFLTLI